MGPFRNKNEGMCRGGQGGTTCGHGLSKMLSAKGRTSLAGK